MGPLSSKSASTPAALRASPYTSRPKVRATSRNWVVKLWAVLVMLASYTTCLAFSLFAPLWPSSFTWSLICSFTEDSCSSVFFNRTCSSLACLFAPPKATLAFLCPLSASARRKRESLYFFPDLSQSPIRGSQFIFYLPRPGESVINPLLGHKGSLHILWKRKREHIKHFW